MKKIVFINLILTMILFSSCEEFLTTIPNDFLAPENYYTSAEKVEAGLMGVYSPLSTRQGGSNNVCLYGQYHLVYPLTMDHLQYSTDVQAANNSAIFIFSSSDSYIDEYWRALYLIISRANIFIQSIENLSIPMDAAAKNAMLGEAYFLRGFCYWHLAVHWGGVPLRTTGDPSKIEVHAPRASLRETYDQAISDLTKAEGMVYKDANHYPNNARITQTTAQAMLARVYLHVAGEPLKDASAWASARDWARKVVASGQHRLDPKYEDVFIRMIQEKPDLDYRESMWEVEFLGVDGESPRTNGLFGGPNGIYCRNQSIGFAYQALCITRTMLAYYDEDSNDKRRDWNIATYTYGASATNTTKVPITNVEGYFIGKYRKDVYTGPKGNNFTSTNYPAMRYADVLLMLAEAANEADGPTDEAINALNQVRERAGVALCANKGETGKISLTNKDEFRAFVKKERARELCYELRTRADLLRWGDLVSEIKATANIMTTATAKRGGNNITDKHVLFPIPANELNTNKLAVQNPGW